MVALLAQSDDGPGARGWQFFNLNFMLQLASYRVVFRASNFNTASALGLARSFL